MKQQALLPLVTYPDANSDAIAANAVAIAKWIGAELHALALNVDIPSLSSPLSHMFLNVPEMVSDAEASSRRRGDHLLEAVEQQSMVAGIQLTTDRISTLLALLTETPATYARYHDISLVGWEADNETCRTISESILFGSGRPAVLMPEHVGPSSLHHVAIAWDGSRVAARAVADARPFLSRATRISVFTVSDEKPLKEKDAGDRLAEGLRARGLSAEAVSLRGEGRPIAQTLQQGALERGCKLLVMGAYGHSRMRDFVLGGATGGILKELLMPVMLSH